MKTFLYIFLLTISLNAIELSKPLLIDMSKTYGYHTGQSSALDIIKNKYSHLKTQVYLVQNEFDLKFSKSVDEIKRILSSKLGSSEKIKLKQFI